MTHRGCPLRRSAAPEPASPKLPSSSGTAASTVDEDPDAKLLWFAAIQGKTILVDQVLNVRRVDVNLRTQQHGDSALHLAIAHMRKNVVKRLLASPDIDPNLASPGAGVPLHLAAHRGYVDGVKLLLQHPRTDPNVTMQSNDAALPRNALMLAIQERHTSVVRLLLSHEAVDPSYASAHGMTALHIAANNGTIWALEMLLDHPRIDVDAQYIRMTPLQVAARRKHKDAVQLFIHHAKKHAAERLRKLKVVNADHGFLDEEPLWRGLANMQGIDRDASMEQGGTERSFMSTSRDKQKALGYSAVGTAHTHTSHNHHVGVEGIECVEPQ